MYAKIISTVSKNPKKAAIFNSLVFISKLFRHNVRILSDQSGRALNCDVFATVGPSFEGIELRIVDEYGNTVDAGVSGQGEVKDPQAVGQDKKGLGLLIVADMVVLKEYVNTKLNKVIESVEHIMQDQHILSDIKSELN